MKQYCLKVHALGQRWIQVEPCRMVHQIRHNLVERKQDGSTHTTWYTRCEGEGHKMEVFPVHMQAIIFANSLKEYEIITLIYNKIMQVRFII